MAHTPPVPAGNQSPFPLQEAPHATSSATEDTQSPVAAVQQGAASARDAIAPLTEKATKFARARPYATAALLGTVALAVINSLRGRRP